MKRLIAFAFLLIAFTSLRAQTPEDLARDIKTNAHSITAIKSVIEKHTASKDTHTSWAYYNDTIGFFQQKKFFQSFTYRVPSGNKDSITRIANLFVTYKDDKVAFIKLEVFHYLYGGFMHGIWRPIYYVDSVYTDSLLSTYNAANKSNFTPQDMYEDECDCFCVIPRQGYNVKVNGRKDSVTLAYEFGEFWGMIINRDHEAIVKNCRSFNTIRRAFGAFCLYVLQRRGEPLSWEEKELLMKIANSNEQMRYRAACKLDPIMQVKNALSPQNLKNMYSYIYKDK